MPPKKPANEPTTREATVVVVVPVLVDTGVVVIKVGLTVADVLIGAVLVVAVLAIVVTVVTVFAVVPEVVLVLLFLIVFVYPFPYRFPISTLSRSSSLGLSVCSRPIIKKPVSIFGLYP